MNGDIMTQTKTLPERPLTILVAALGGEGKGAIHPSQIELANETFSPLPDEVDRAQRIMVAMAEAAAEGRGAVSLDGRLIDAASIKMAENVIARVERLSGS